MRIIGKACPRLKGDSSWVKTALVLSAGSVLLLVALVGCSTPAPAATSTPEPVATGESTIPLDDDPVLGSHDAPVTMIEYSEYLCPYCRRFVLETMPLIEEEYIDSGQVKLVFRDFPVHGEPAVILAMVAECAADQGNFWDMHVLLFEKVEEWSESDDPLNVFQGYAEEIDIDPQELVNCLEQGKPYQRILEDYNVGTEDGVKGTPSFLVNGNLVVGAQPFEEFQRIIEEALAKSG